MARRGTGLEAVRVRVLGGLDVDGLSEPELGSRKGRTLLKALVLAKGAPVSVDRLADIVWGDDQPSKPSEQLGVLVSRLRTAVGTDRIARTDAGYAVRYDWLDLDELEARVEEAADALAAGRLGAARTAAEAATMLVRGDVVPEEDGAWVETHRAAASALSLAARRIAASAAERAGDHPAAAAHADLALAADPCDEESLRILMRAHVSSGRPGSALAAYARTRERLAEELGVSPTAETEALHDAIVMGPDDATPAAPTTPSATAGRSLPGRAKELAALDDALLRAGRGASVVVVVRGEGGIGKTTLVTTWLASLTRDVFVLAGRCDELGRDLPLQAIVDAIAAEVRGVTPDALAERLGPAFTTIAPLIEGAGTPELGTGGATVVVDAEVGRSALFAALCTVVDRLRAGRETVLFVDDVHLAAPSTIAWLAFATRRLPVLLVATSRSASGLPWSADVVLDLPPLTIDAVAEIVGHERAADVHARTGGQPLLMAALVDHADADDLPTSVAEAVERRVLGLGAAEPTIRTAAVLGPAVDLDLLAHVTREAAATLLSHLEAGARAGLLTEVGGFRFRHELERVALEASLGATRRSFVHREAAQALATRPGVDPLDVAVHARLGGEVATAVNAYIAAARMSTARFDLVAAENHLDTALALEEAPAALIARARVRMAANRLDEAASDADRAVTLGADASAMEVAGWISYYQRQPERALAYADEALARATDPGLRVSCLALTGRVLHGSGELSLAVERFEQATSLDAPAEVRGIASIWLAQAETHRGEPERALGLLARALVRPDALVHPFAPLHGSLSRVMALGQQGRVRDALAACDELDRAVQRAGESGARMVGPAANCRAWILRWTGNATAADESNERGVAASDPAGPRAEAYYAGMLDLVDGRLLAADLDGARDMLERLRPIEQWNGTMAWHQRHRFVLARARLALAAGDRDRAASLADSVAKDAGARGAARYESFAAAIHAIATPDRFSADTIDRVVSRLESCAAMDAWPLLATLARTFDVATWRDAADRLAANVIAGAPDERAAHAFVARVLT